MLESLVHSIADPINDLLRPIADTVVQYVWSWPSQAPLLVIVLLGTGLFITVRLALIQVRGFRHAIDITRGRYDDPNDAGDLKHYQALTTALSATVGIGNIAGVAIAIRMGGPGALFWMWVTAFFGMALKFTECTLAVAFRTVHEDGSVSGGPMYYIERGLGSKWKGAKVMALTFAALAAICSFGTGNMNQANTMADQMESQFGLSPALTGFVFAALVAMVILGGIRRIGQVTAILAPSMAALYVGGALIILTIHIADVPAAFVTIVHEAFVPRSMMGGATGSFLLTLMWGIRRGLFSNEAGQGSAPIAHATAKTDEPVREGLVALLEPFIDTLVICSMTGLVIVTTGAWEVKQEQTFPLAALEAVVGDVAVDADLPHLRSERRPASLEVREGRVRGGGFVVLDALVEDAIVRDGDGRAWTGALQVGGDGGAAADGEGKLSVDGRALLTGAPLTASAFSDGLPGHHGDLIVTFAVLLFAVSTAISWSYYGDRATEYLFGTRAIHVYRWIFVVFFFLGAILPLETVWTFGDVALGLMSFPNLVTLLLLSPLVVRMTREYFSAEHRRYW